MSKYLIKRILRALLSVVIVVAVIMTMVYAFLDKRAIFANDPTYTKRKSNAKEAYQMQQWERFGYLDWVPYEDYLKELGSMKAAENIIEFDDALHCAIDILEHEEAAEELRAHVIMQFYSRLATTGFADYLAPVILKAAEMASVPVCMHLDHGAGYEAAAISLKNGASGIMVDFSKLSLEENIEKPPPQ